MHTDSNPSVATSFAAANRENLPAVRAQRAVLMSEPLATDLLESMPCPAVVLNTRRQIVAVNSILAESLGLPDPEGTLGSRFGEVVHCVHAAERPGGCGTSSACSQCGAVAAVLECLATRRRITRDCRVLTEGDSDGGAFDLRVRASHLALGSQDFVVVALLDIRDSRRREVLERLVFGSLLGTVRDVHDRVVALGDVDPLPDAAAAHQRDLARLSDTALDQIETQRTLLAAERGELEAAFSETDLAPLLRDLVTRMEEDPAASGRALRLETVRRCPVETDATLLRQALAHLVRNALEATAPGGTVEITCEYEQEIATVSVHNDGVIPGGVQHQIFQRSFSTKPAGAGQGAFGARLIVERTLGGKVAFMSEPRVGTLFLVLVPRRAPGRVASRAA
jgi:signal transduction histidine kinase